jgi:hypothetical protein
LGGVGAVTKLENVVLELIRFSNGLRTGCEIYNTFFRLDDSTLPGDVASAIWRLRERGLVKISTNLKIEAVVT